MGHGGATAGHDMHTGFRNGAWTVANMLGTDQQSQGLRTRPSPSPKVMMMMTKVMDCTASLTAVTAPIATLLLQVPSH